MCFCDVVAWDWVDLDRLSQRSSVQMWFYFIEANFIQLEGNELFHLFIIREKERGTQDLRQEALESTPPELEIEIVM